MDLLIWAPGAFYLVRFERFSLPLAVFCMGSAALCIECLQLLVLSQFTDVTDLVKALTGAGLGG